MRNKGLMALLVGLCLCTAWPVWGENEKPFVIPELREWKGADGYFALPRKAKMVVLDASLEGVARELAKDYTLLFDRPMNIKKASALKESVQGAIVLQLVDDERLGEEGYTLHVDDNVVLAANTPKGVYWGTRTILQVLEQHEGTRFPKGEVVDYPDYALRGFMIDAGRKYIPLDYLKKYTRVMAYYKMNTLQVHLNDNGFYHLFGHDWDRTYAAFRMESEFFPGLTATDGSYGKDAFRQFQKEAASIGVEIIPEIDVPAHSLAFSHYRKSLGSKEYGMDHLDLDNPALYAFCDSLFAEYLSGDDPVFVGRRVHIGTDEYSNRKKATVEKFRAFTDHYIRLVESYGKQACVWGALTHAKGDTPVKADGVVMNLWYNGYADPKEMIRLGYDLISISDGHTYIVPAAGYYYDYLNLQFLYEHWSPNVIGNQTFEQHHPQILGGMYAVWNDVVGNGITVKDIHHRCFPGLQAIAAKSWAATSSTLPFAEFDAKRHGLSEAPGVNELARIEGPAHSTVYALDRLRPRTHYPHEAIGYDYSVSFDIEGCEEERGTVLLSNDETEFYLSSPVDGRVAFVREGYLNTFDYRIKVGQKVRLRIEGDNDCTRLYENDKLVQALPRTKRYVSEKDSYFYVSTLVFPLQQSGDFKSSITNVQVDNYCQSE